MKAVSPDRLRTHRHQARLVRDALDALRYALGHARDRSGAPLDLRRVQAHEPALQVSYDRHHVAQQGRITRDVDVVNVMAVLPGRSARRVYISGHYDR